MVSPVARIGNMLNRSPFLSPESVLVLPVTQEQMRVE